MSDTEYTKGNCYECGGSVEYPSWVYNEEAPCPHCKRTVILRGCIKREFVPAAAPMVPLQTTVPPAQPPISTQPDALLAEITRHNKKMENNMLPVKLFFGMMGFLIMLSLAGC